MLRQTPNEGKGQDGHCARGCAGRWNTGTMVLCTHWARTQPARSGADRGFVVRHSITQSDLIIGARNFDEMPTTRRIANELGRHPFPGPSATYVEATVELSPTEAAHDEAVWTATSSWLRWRE